MADEAKKSKPGFKTTEFWFTAITQVCGLLVASDAIPTDSPIMKVAGLVMMALTALGYQHTRGSVKKAEALANGKGGS